MSVFPATPVSLLAKLAAERTQTCEDGWVRFFAMYQPAIIAFARHLGVQRDAEDVAQDVFVKLVEIFRRGRYDPRRGSFRAYLATMIRNVVINIWQKAAVRAADRHDSIDADENSVELGVPSETAVLLDVKWRLARHEAAREHVLTKTALSAKSKDIYRAYVLDERPIDEVAATFGVSNNAVSQIKTRVERMIAQFEALFGA